jgi:hypothetical protein
MPEGVTYPNCFGPYLRYAISTNFEYFKFFDESERFKLFLLVEFKKAGQADDFATDINNALSARNPALPGPSVDLGPADDNTPYATMRARTTAVTTAVQGSAVFDIWVQYVSRVELSLPLKPSVELIDIEKQRKPDERWRDEESPGSLLIGMLDDGCPFAAAHFLRALQNGSASTRVRAIWDQNQGRQAVVIDNNTVFGKTLSDFKYGLEYRRHSEPVGGALPRHIGLDEWTRLHVTPAGSIDEDSCYADARFKRLASQQSHGAHVMDVLAGRIPISSRIGPSRPGQDRRDPPSWAPGNSATDPACDADVVFVQFSDDCIRDSTGVWLKAYVLDGIRYILSFAEQNVTKNVIVNLSYGPTTGPHDGTAELESLLTAFVAEYNGSGGKPKLEIFLAAGNAYLSEGHVRFKRDNEQPDYVEWTWRLPPDNAVLCFAEVWMNSADSDHVIVTLTSPSGAATHVDPPVIWGTDIIWRLEVGPTIAAPNIVATEHGDYTIRVAGIGENVEVHAYVARSDPNMNVRTGAKLSRFVDPKWEQTKSAEASCKRINGEFDKDGSLVSRYGTLNGIATAEDPSVHVAGGYILANGRKSPYSSAGPARSGPLPLRVGPDYVLPCDESYALQGIRAGGTRSGVVFRLIGTSTAAPQLARWVADSALPPPTDVPTTTSEIEQRGGGDIEPP